MDRGDVESLLNESSVSSAEYIIILENRLIKSRGEEQGDIESVAAMSPMGLTQLFEHISGSEQYKKQYEELESQKSEAEERTAFASQKKRTIMAEKKQKLEQKQEADKHMRLQKELVCSRPLFIPFFHPISSLSQALSLSCPSQNPSPV
jgi:chromosome segregation ATPase